MGVKVTNFGKILTDGKVGFRGELKFPDAFLPTKVVGEGEQGRAIDDLFGSSVSIDGALAVIGAPYHDYDEDGEIVENDAGSVFVFRRTWDSWEFAYRVTAPTRSEGEKFGTSVSLYGNTLVVGAPNSDSDKGVAYVFDVQRDAYTYEATLVPTTREEGQLFGFTVVARENTVYVGNHMNGRDTQEDEDVVEAGAFWVYTKSDSVWSLSKKIIAGGNERNVDDAFGYAVAAHNDTLVIGMPGYDNVERGRIDVGQTYVYKWVEDHWEIVQVLSLDDRASGDRFGAAVAVNGSTIVIGAPGKNGGEGSAYVFYDDGMGKFGLTNTLTPVIQILPEDYTPLSDPALLANAAFGSSISMNEDTILIGAPTQPAARITGLSSSTPYTYNVTIQNGVGFAYVYSYENGVAELELQTTGAYRFGSYDVEYEAGEFGYAVSVNSNVFAVGEPKASKDPQGGNALVDSGLAHFYVRNEGTWSWSKTVTGFAVSRNAYDHFASVVAANERFMVFGAPNHDYDTRDDNMKTDAGAVFIWENVGGSWQFLQKVVSGSRVEGELFGTNIALDNETMFVYAPQTNSSGAVYVFKLTDGEFVQTQRIDRSELGTNNKFGEVLLARDGWLFAASTNAAVSSTTHGQVYAYRYNSVSGNYVENAEIKPSGAISGNSRFGTSMDFRDNILVVGAPGHPLDITDSSSRTNAGAAFVFSFTSPNTWTMIGKIAGPGARRLYGDYMGYSVASYGDTLVVGAPNADYAGIASSQVSNSGQVYVYKWKDDGWRFETVIGAPNRYEDQHFGWAVDAGEDRIIISAIGENHISSSLTEGFGDGVVYVFERSYNEWIHTATLKNTEPYGSYSFRRRFGYSLALDGDRLIIGEPGNNLDASGANSVQMAGAAWIYEYANGSWTQKAKLTIDAFSTRYSQSSAGWSVDIHGDMAVVGVPFDRTDAVGGNTLTNSGSALIYRRSPTGTWNPERKVAGWIQDRNEDDEFGTDIAAHGDWIVIGAPNHGYDANSENFVTDAGALFVYKWEDNQLVYKQKLVAFPADNRIRNIGFGEVITMSDTHIVASAYRWEGSEAGRDIGKVWTWRLSNGLWINETSFVTSSASERVSTTLGHDTKFGYSLAIHGKTLVIGVPGARYDQIGQNSLDDAGAIEIYEFGTNNWNFKGYFVPPWRENNDRLGQSVTVYDGIVVGGGRAVRNSTQGDNSDGASIAGGAAWIWTRAADGTWEYTCKIARGNVDRFNTDNFGTSVSVSGDIMIVGAPYHKFDENARVAMENAGAAFVFRNVKGQWLMESKIVSPARVANERFGTEVTVLDDMVWVGAPGRTSFNDYSSAGRVYGFRRGASQPITRKIRRTVKFNATGSDQSWIVPEGVENITIYAIGGAGHTGDTGKGGNGGFVRANVPVTGGDILTLKVGKRGTAAGAGGGRTEVLRSGTTLLVAGGGGGYANISGFSNTIAGSAGGEIGESGYWPGPDAVPGLGATQEAGGASHNLSGWLNGSAGSAKQGGSGPSDSGVTIVPGGWPNGGSGSVGSSFTIGGGGDGWFGGSAGSVRTSSIGLAVPGGGGSSYIAPGIEGFTQAIKTGHNENYVVFGIEGTPGVNADGFLMIEYFEEFTYSSWNHEVTLNPQNTLLTHNDLEFGWRLESDGSTLLVGTKSRQRPNGNTYSTVYGSVEVYEFDGLEWAFSGSLRQFGPEANVSDVSFGASLAIYDDIIAVGAPDFAYDPEGLNNLSSAGTVFLYKKENGSWTEWQRVIPPGDARSSGDLIGQSMSYYNDYVVIGAPGHAYNSEGIDKLINAGAVYIWKWDGSELKQFQKLSAPRADRVAQQAFGSQVYIGPIGIIVSAPGNNSSVEGKIYTYELIANTWVLKQTITKPAGLQTEHRFARAFAITKDESSLAVGSTYDTTSTTYTGSVSIYSNSVGNWVFETNLQPTGSNAITGGDGFGSVIDFVDDVLVVGAPSHAYDQDGRNSATNAGAVWVFMKESNVWTQQQKIVAWGHEQNNNDLLGKEVSATQERFAISAPNHPYDAEGNNYLANAGAVYIWRWNSTDGFWELEQKITPPTRHANQNFGTSIVLTDTMLVVGAPNSDSISGTGTGLAWVFERDEENTSPWCWSSGYELIPTGTNAHNTGDSFGASVAIANENEILIGAPDHDYDASGANAVNNAGAIFSFRRDENDWVLSQKIVSSGQHMGTSTDSGRYENQRFGAALAASETDLIVGAPNRAQDPRGSDTMANAGIAVVFSRETSEDAWTQIQYLTAKKSSPDADERVGNAVAAYGDFFVASAIGAKHDADEDNFYANAGAVYVWYWTGATWIYLNKIASPVDSAFGRNANAYFGASLVLHEDMLIVGAPGTTVNANVNAGVVLVYRFDTDHFEYQYSIVPDLSGTTKKDVRFGSSLDFDGETLIVGAPTWQQAAVASVASGRVFFFEYDSVEDEFTETAAFGDPLDVSNAQLGASVSVKDDLAVAGMPGDTSNRGSALIFRRVGGAWTVEDRIHSQRPMKQSGDAFGSSVAFYGNYMAVGAPTHDYNRLNRLVSDGGAVYLFELISDTWTFKQKITPTGVNDHNPNDNFGTSLSFEQGILGVGAPGHGYDNTNTFMGPNLGAVFFFEEGDDGYFYQSRKVSPEGYNATTSTNSFGATHVIDNNWMVVGAPTHRYGHTSEDPVASNGGAVFVYRFIDNEWVFVNKAIPQGPNSRQSELRFGDNISFSNGYLVVGTPESDYDEYGEQIVTDSGNAWVYALESSETLSVNFVGGVFTEEATSSIELDVDGKFDSVRIDDGGEYTAHPEIVFNNDAFTGYAMLEPTSVAKVELLSSIRETSNPPTITIVNDPYDTTGSGATAEFVTSGDAVSEVIVTNGGEGYDDVPTVTSSSGTGVVLEAVLAPTSVQSISLTSLGSGLMSFPSVLIDAPGLGGTTASASLTFQLDTAELGANTDVAYVGEQFTISLNMSDAVLEVTSINASKQVTGLTIVDAGEFSSVASWANRPTNRVTTTAPSRGLITESVDSTVNMGSITDSVDSDTTYGVIRGSNMTVAIKAKAKSVTLTNAGSGYRRIPSVSFSPSNLGLAAVATIVPTSVEAVHVVSGGSNVSMSTTIDFSGGTPEVPATATAVLGGAEVVGIKIVNAGSGYTRTPKVVFSDPENFAARVLLEPTAIDSVEMLTSDDTLTRAGRLSFRKRIAEPVSNRKANQLFGKKIDGYADILAIGAPMNYGDSNNGSVRNESGMITVFEVKQKHETHSNRILVDGWLDASSINEELGSSFTVSMWMKTTKLQSSTNLGTLFAVHNTIDRPNYMPLTRITSADTVEIPEGINQITVQAWGVPSPTQHGEYGSAVIDVEEGDEIGVTFDGTYTVVKKNTDTVLQVRNTYSASVEPNPFALNWNGEDGIKGNSGAVVITTTSESANKHLLRVKDNGEVIVSGINSYVLLGQAALNDEWNHVAYTVNGGTAKVYVNGTLIGSSSVLSSTNAGETVAFGAMWGEYQGNGDEPSLNPFTGYLSDIAIWDTALTQTDIEDVIETGAQTVKGENLKAVWAQN